MEQKCEHEHKGRAILCVHIQLHQWWISTGYTCSVVPIISFIHFITFPGLGYYLPLLKSAWWHNDDVITHYCSSPSWSDPQSDALSPFQCHFFSMTI